MNNKKKIEKLEEFAEGLREISADADMTQKAEQSILSAIKKQTKPSARPEQNIWRFIMKTKIAKFAAAAVIIIAVLIGINQFGGSIDGASVAWAQVIEKVEQSHAEYMKQLLLAVEEKDAEKTEFYADLLSEFWQNLCWLARAELNPESKEQMLAMIDEKKTEQRDESDQIGIRIFLENVDKFGDWLGNIDDIAWLNETVHVSKQLEEYAEEMREPARHQEIEFSYAEHCLPSFVTYCQWFEQLPWDNPHQYMTPAMLLTEIQRDMKIARWEMEALENRDVIRFVERCVLQAQKNALDLDKKTLSTRTKEQRNLCRQLTRRINELCALITYAEIARQDFFEQVIRQKQFNRSEKYDQIILIEEFGNKGPFADYYIERIDQSLDLCKQLLKELEPMR
jgi:hypothetical protein